MASFRSGDHLTVRSCAVSINIGRLVLEGELQVRHCCRYSRLMVRPLGVCVREEAVMSSLAVQV